MLKVAGGGGGSGSNGTVTSVTAGSGLAGGTITTSGTISLANTTVVAGTYSPANITVDAQGRITAASNVASGGTGTVTSITAGTGLSGGTITSSGTIAINNTTVTAAAYGSANTVATLTVNAQGQLTAAANSTIAIDGSQITSGIINVSVGGTGVNVSSGANSVVLRDTNQNVTANAFFDGFTSVAASGTTITLTVASTPAYSITGSGGQVIQLPNATTLPNGTIFSFNNNQSSGSITVNNNSGTLIASIPSGGYVTIVLLSNATSAGSWDRHDQTPSNVSWSTNTLDYPGSITSATWNGSTVQVNRGGSGAATFTAGYLKANGTAAFTTVASVPNTDVTGLGTMSTQNAGTVTITGGTINSVTETNGTYTNATISSVSTPITAAQGGTGLSTLTLNNVVLGNATASVKFVAPGTAGNVLTSDGTTWSSAAAGGGSSFPSGTLMLFQQTAAPTGWTKQTTHDNKALRVVTGTASNGGSVAFTTAFASQAVAGTVGSTTLTTNQMPSHFHTSGAVDTAICGGGIGGGQSSASTSNTGSTGSGGSHNHTFTGTAINLAVSYVDLIIASKT